MQDRKLQNAFFLGLLILVSSAFLGLLSGFFQPIFWAATVGIIFLPVQHYFERKLNGRTSIAAILAVTLIFITVLLPALLIASAVVNEAAMIYGMIQRGEIDPGAALRWIEDLSQHLAERAA